MQRKVIQQGPSTLMVSLPSKWVKENNIKKGEELTVDWTNNQLTICPGSSSIEKKITLVFKSKEDYQKFVLDQESYGNKLELIKHQLLD